MNLVKLLSPEQVANMLGVTAATVREWARTKRIKSCKVGTLTRFYPTDVQAFIDAGRSDSSNDAEN